MEALYVYFLQRQCSYDLLEMHRYNLYKKIATDKAKNMKTQCCTLSVFFDTHRETIVATTLKVFSFRLVHVMHVVSHRWPVC